MLERFLGNKGGDIRGKNEVKFGKCFNFNQVGAQCVLGNVLEGLTFFECFFLVKWVGIIRRHFGMFLF